MTEKLFSERYGYIKPSDEIIVERIPIEVNNAIITAFDDLLAKDFSLSKKLEKHIFVRFLNERGDLFPKGNRLMFVSIPFLEENTKWYLKLDLIEFSLKFIKNQDEVSFLISEKFVTYLNKEFERLRFGYRIINDSVVPIVNKKELETIEKAIDKSSSNVQEHFIAALSLYSKRPEPDYRNSIKESITAVEALLRELTGKNTLGEGLNALEQNRIVLHPMLKSSFEKLYGYTNNKNTGIRHALMDDTKGNVPQSEEALFILITCSAFVNYLNSKLAKK